MNTATQNGAPVVLTSEDLFGTPENRNPANVESISQTVESFNNGVPVAVTSNGEMFPGNISPELHQRKVTMLADIVRSFSGIASVFWM